MEPRIVNADPRYSGVRLIEPASLGYIHLAAEVRPPSRPGPIISGGREKRRLLGRLKEIARRFERLDAVEKATVFDAIAFAPPSAYVRRHARSAHLARFDVVVLIETTSPQAAREVRATPEYGALLGTLTREARRVHAIAARDAKRIADVDKTRKGLFLFNHFVADDAEVALGLWDYLAGWYEAETGLENSTLLVPLEGEESDYMAINNARWEIGLPRFLWRQFSKKSFRSYVLANLEANRVGAMPVLYRLA